MEAYRLLYQINEKSENIRLLGKKFYDKNKSSGYFIYKSNNIGFKEFFETKNINENIIELYLILCQTINDKSFMFYKCVNLLKFDFYDGIYKDCPIRTINILVYEEKESISNLCEENNSSECTLIQSYHEYDECQEYSSIYKTQQKSSNHSTIKSYYNLLKKIPEKKNNIYAFTEMFFGCILLNSLPDLSKWDTSKVTDMSGMFTYCNSLTSFPGISNWDISNVKSLCGMFAHCLSLESPPDIGNWKTQNVKDFSFLFYNCEKLKSFPELKWQINKTAMTNNIIGKCPALKSPPTIIKDINKNVAAEGNIKN